MTRYASPVHVRLLRVLRRWFNNALRTLCVPIRRPEILLATGGADPAKVREIRERLDFLFRHLKRPLPIREVRKTSTILCCTAMAVVAVESSAVPAFARKHLAWVADLDYETNPMDGWALMDLGTYLSGRPSTDVAARQRLTSAVQRLRGMGPRPVYLFGTGPSLGSAGERSFADGIIVVCNTIVRDPRLWNHLEPDFLVAGDAHYHFGHTPHACSFRADALQRLRESKGRTLFVYPALFDVVVRAEFGDVESQLVPIPWGEHTDVTVDLTRTFGLPRVGNVLNALLLPVGCTLGNDLRLWGFDGRAPDDSGFWSNSDRHAYPELLSTVREAHPAFFAELVPTGHEDQYVRSVHGDLLDVRLTEAESRGFRFRMLHPSWTPTLQKRYA